MRATRSLAVLLLFVPAIAAQGAVIPPTVRAKQNTPGLNPPSVPAADVQQVNMIQLPNDPPGTWTCTMTCGTLATGNGGVGGTDLLSGKYDAINDVFTPDLFAAGLNTSGAEFGLMLDPTGLIAVWDLLPGFPQLATRPNLTSPFTPIGAVGGLPTQSYYDPSLCLYNGQLQLLHVYGTNIAMSPLNLATRTISTPRVITTTARTGGTANSPTPIMTTTGEIIAVSHHDVVGQDNDHYLSFDLNPNTNPLLFIDTATWKNNGGFCGGTFFDAEFTPSPYHVYDQQVIWWTGGRVPAGGTMEISAFVPPANNSLYQSFFFLTRGFFGPVPVPGIGGQLGIDPTLLILFDIGLHVPQTGRAVTSLPIPQDPSLAGVALPAQGMTIDLNTLNIFLLNTASLKIE